MSWPALTAQFRTNLIELVGIVLEQVQLPAFLQKKNHDVQKDNRDERPKMSRQ